MASSDLDPALVTLGVDGTKKYRESFELVYRREATTPNEIWQADHTELDIWVVDERGRPARPWLTAIEDDHSRAIAGYAVNLEAPSALTTARRSGTRSGANPSRTGTCAASRRYSTSTTDPTSPPPTWNR